MSLHEIMFKNLNHINLTIISALQLRLFMYISKFIIQFFKKNKKLKLEVCNQIIHLVTHKSCEEKVTQEKWLHAWSIVSQCHTAF